MLGTIGKMALQAAAMAAAGYGAMVVVEEGRQALKGRNKSSGSSKKKSSKKSSKKSAKKSSKKSAKKNAAKLKKAA